MIIRNNVITLSKSKDYFLNAKFDGSFIVDYLLKSGYKVASVPMTKEELIQALVQARITETRLKKGYEVKGDGSIIQYDNKNIK